MELRILYNSKDPACKTPFGVLTPKESCSMTVAIPSHCQTTGVSLILQREDGGFLRESSFCLDRIDSPYEYYRITFSLESPGLFFYYFQIYTRHGSFRLFKYGDETNMEAGDLWQISCVSRAHPVPEDYQGRVFYQIFPDRFHRSGFCDCTGKLQPYWVHKDPADMPVFRPDANGEMRNNDFFGGNLRGILEKLPFLQDMGVGAIYLNPIFMAFSNHRYDTADYERIDPMLGTEEDFCQLCQEAHDRGIKIILDGVFSHTGSNSRYFDSDGLFGDGALSDPDSSYRSWYMFQKYPDEYTSWWGFRTLPCLNKSEPSFQNYIFRGENSILSKWLRAGADGFRLDVVDELPDDFLTGLRDSLRKLKPDAFLIGEVWEDASNKISYNTRRQYFTAAQLDSVMNYPWRNAILDYVRGTDDGRALSHIVMTLAENYPLSVLNANLNLLSSHDVPRAITAILDPTDGDREELYDRMQHITPEQLVWAKQRFQVASFLQFMLPGCPCIYYGDDAGMTGYKDPFNRQFYPWGREDTALQDTLRQLAKLKNSQTVLKKGNITVLAAGDGHFAFRRMLDNRSITLWCNVSSQPWSANPDGICLLGDPELPPLGYCAMDTSADMSSLLDRQRADTAFIS